MNKTNSMPVIFRLICVRHGETEANREMRVQGHLDIPLSKVGQTQAQEAGNYLNSVNLTRAYTSDLIRARETCENIIGRNKIPLERMKTDVRIRERNFGEAEGMLFKEMFDMSTAAGSSWPAFTPPGAETLSQVQERFVQFFKELCQSVYDRSLKNNLIIEDTEEDLQNIAPAEQILVVSHGVSLKQLFLHFQKTLECEGFPDGEDILKKLPPNSSISEFVVKYSPRRYRLKCLRLYDTKHLEDLN